MEGHGSTADDSRQRVEKQCTLFAICHTFYVKMLKLSLIIFVFYEYEEWDFGLVHV